MKASVKLLLNIIIFVILLLVFSFLAVEVVVAKSDLFDSQVFLYLGPYTADPGVIRAMRYLSFLGSPILLSAAHILIGILLLVKKQRVDAIALTLIAVGGVAIHQLLKQYFHRPRPDISHIELLNTPSFPSGHSMSSLVFTVVVIYLVRKTQLKPILKRAIAITLIMISILIGISRIVLKVHYASDVIAGFSIGMVWILFAFWLKERMMSRRSIATPPETKEGHQQ